MCGVIIILHVIVCVVVKNVLLLQYRNVLFTSYSHYMEILWIAVVGFEMILGLLSIGLVIAKCEYKEPGRFILTLEFLMTLLDLILQARIFYILYGTDLCESAKMKIHWAEGDAIWITTFILILLDNLYHYTMLLYKCHDILDKELCCPICIFYIIYILLTLLASGANIYTSLYYDCKAF